jgi:hypothetical protein
MMVRTSGKPVVSRTADWVWFSADGVTLAATVVNVDRTQSVGVAADDTPSTETILFYASISVAR